MEESPWGVPDDSFGATLPKPPSPPVDIAPLPSSLSLAAPSWGDEGDAWGSSNDTYALPVSSPGAGSSSAPYGRDNDHPTLPSSAAPDFRDDAWPTEDTTGHFPGPDATGGDHLADDSMPTRIPSPPPLPVHAHDPYDGGDSAEPHGVRGGGAASPHDDGEERGWGGASPDLPPISSLRLAGSPSPDDDGRAAGWTPEAAENFDEDIPPPPLPTVEEVFASAKPRRDSAEAAGGGDAWGSSQGWEERMKAEAEARAQERGDEPEEDTSTQAQEQEASDGYVASSPTDRRPQSLDLTVPLPGLRALHQMHLPLQAVSPRSLASSGKERRTARPSRRKSSRVLPAPHPKPPASSHKPPRIRSRSLRAKVKHQQNRPGSAEEASPPSRRRPRRRRRAKKRRTRGPSASKRSRPAGPGAHPPRNRCSRLPLGAFSADSSAVRPATRTRVARRPLRLARVATCRAKFDRMISMPSQLVVSAVRVARRPRRSTTISIRRRQGPASSRRGAKPRPPRCRWARQRTTLAVLSAPLPLLPHRRLEVVDRLRSTLSTR